MIVYIELTMHTNTIKTTYTGVSRLALKLDRVEQTHEILYPQLNTSEQQA